MACIPYLPVADSIAAIAKCDQTTDPSVIEDVVVDVWERVATRETAYKAIIVHRAREAGISTGRLSKLIGVNSSRLSQLDAYGAFVEYRVATDPNDLKMGHVTSERRMRPYLEDARRGIKNDPKEIAGEAWRMAQEGIQPRADARTGELIEEVPKHERQVSADAFRSAEAAASSIGNVTKRVQATVDQVGTWSRWRDDAHVDTVDMLKKKLRWTIRVYTDVLDELA